MAVGIQAVDTWDDVLYAPHAERRARRMDLQTLIILITVLGATVGALSHGLQLFDRSRRWAASRRERRAGVEDAEAEAESPPFPTARRLPLWLLLLILGLVGLGGAALTWWGRSNTAGTARAVVGDMVPVPNKPAIAILPFSNVSGESGQAFLAEGLTENLTSTLAAVSSLLVVAHHSVLAYKDRAVSIQQVAREQGVRHVLSGGVQRAGNRLRVTAQLADAASGRQVWAERYDRDLRDVFAVQDDITREIIVALQVTLDEGEQARIRYRGTRNFEAWSRATRAHSFFQRYEKNAIAEAKHLFEEALAADPDYAWATAFLAAVHFIEARFGFSSDPARSMQRAFEIGTRAIALDPALPDAHATLGAIYLARRQYEEAVAAGRKAIALGPNDAESHAILAQTMFYLGEWDEAIDLSRRAIRLSPRYPSWYLLWQIWGLTFKEDYDAAIIAARRMVEIAESPQQKAVALQALAFALSGTQRDEEARKHVAEARALAPRVSIEYYLRTSFFRDPAHLDRLVAALRKVGVPESSSKARVLPAASSEAGAG